MSTEDPAKRQMWPPVFVSDTERLLLVSCLVAHPMAPQRAPSGSLSATTTAAGDTRVRPSVNIGRLAGGRIAVLVSLVAVHVQVGWQLSLISLSPPLDSSAPCLRASILPVD
jgi:hypothetical protein